MPRADWLRAPIANALANDSSWRCYDSPLLDRIAEIVATALQPVIDAHYVPRTELDQAVAAWGATNREVRERAERAERERDTLAAALTNALPYLVRWLDRLDHQPQLDFA